MTPDELNNLFTEDHLDSLEGTVDPNRLCHECGDEMVKMDYPGYDEEGCPVPDYTCDGCGVGIFTTVDRQTAAHQDQRQYEEDTGFQKPIPFKVRPDFEEKKAGEQ